VRARRFLWALWITLAVLWVCASIWPLVLSVVTCFHKSEPVVRQVCNDHPFSADEIFAELELGFGPPLVLLLIGFIGFRIAARFKSAKS
jgi:hypothetical protein